MPAAHAIQSDKCLFPIVLKYVPAGHNTHESLSLPCAYVPDGHATQLLELSVAEYLPAEHIVQIKAPAAEYEPVSHCKHVDVALAPIASE